MGFIVSIKTELKIYYNMSTSKILLEIQDMLVIRGLEIYDRPKILNCNLYFVTTMDVSLQMSIAIFLYGGATKRHFFGTWRPD